MIIIIIIIITIIIGQNISIISTFLMQDLKNFLSLEDEKEHI